MLQLNLKQEYHRDSITMDAWNEIRHGIFVGVVLSCCLRKPMSVYYHPYLCWHLWLVSAFLTFNGWCRLSLQSRKVSCKSWKCVPKRLIFFLWEWIEFFKMKIREYVMLVLPHLHCLHQLAFRLNARFLLFFLTLNGQLLGVPFPICSLIWAVGFFHCETAPFIIPPEETAGASSLHACYYYQLMFLIY